MMYASIIIASDKGYTGERDDKCAPIIYDSLTKYGFNIIETKIVPDDRNALSQEIGRSVDIGSNLILTSGGTGMSKRDVTPEATRDIIQREVPGIPEAMRAYSMQFTGRAMLSRSVAGICENCLIVNLPGSPKAVSEVIDFIMPHIIHGIETLLGITGECSR